MFPLTAPKSSPWLLRKMGGRYGAWVYTMPTHLGPRSMKESGAVPGPLTSSLRVSESEPYFLPHMLRADLKLDTVALSRPGSVSPGNLALCLKARLSSMGSSCPSRNGTGYCVPHHLPLPCAHHSRRCRCVPRGPELSESSRAGHVEQSI